MITGGSHRTPNDVLIVLGIRAEGTQDEPLAALFVLLGEDAHKMLHDLLRRIAFRVGVVDHGVVRFSEGEHHAVKFGAVLERLGKLEAEIVAVRVAEKIKLPILVDELGKILENALRNEYLTVPIVERLAYRMGELAYLTQFGTRLAN